MKHVFTALVLSLSLMAVACGKTQPKQTLGDYCTLGGFDSNQGAYKYLCTYPNSGTPPVRGLIYTDADGHASKSCYTLDGLNCE